jgi:dipeptidyl aminopeptidase/acylaminoacyl peptidase
MKGMVPEDIYALAGANDPRISPDGKNVAYMSWWIDRDQNEYRSAIYIAPLDGFGEPKQFTAGAKRDASPRWSPDGKLLAFTSTRDDDKAQLFVMASDGGEARRLTDLKEGVDAPAWSPDGTKIVFTARVPDEAYEEEDEKKRRPRRFRRLQFKLDNKGWIGDRRNQLFMVAVDGSAEPQQLTDGDFEHDAPVWSPDGSRIAFSSARHDDWDVRPNTHIFVMEARDGAQPEQITSAEGISGSPSWSPDSARIAYSFTPGLFDDPRHGQIAVVDVASRATATLTEVLDRNCAPYPAVREPVWHGNDLLFCVEDSGNQHLYRAPSDGSGKPELVVGGERTVAGFDAGGETVAHVATTMTEAAEVYAGDRRISAVGDELVRARDLSQPERFTAVSADGSEVDAWIMRPPGFETGKRYPVLFNIHGGPFTQYGNKFFDEFHVYTGAGYAVVYSNPRGSSGYSEEWGRAIRGPSEGGPGMGTVDYADCIAVVDEALRRFDFCDGERLGVLGGSYGGYMTSWIVGHTDRFKAAVSERAVNFWPSMHGSSDVGWMFRGHVGSFYFDDPEAWEKISPSTHAKNINTPLLILHSEDDLRANIEQGEQLFSTLRILKRDVEMVRFPGESHELSRSGSPAHRVMRFEVILEWFDRYLK